MELRLRLVSRLEHSGAEWWRWGRCPFFSILSLMRIKKMGQDRILAEARKNLEDSAPKL